MRVLAIDPGYIQSAIVEFDGSFIHDHRTVPNEQLLKELPCMVGILVIEQIAAMGMSVGEEVFETVFWTGRFAQSFHGECHRIKRHAIKMHLCGNMRAKDPNIRQALLDRFGPGKERALGTKKAPGALYGIKGDEWAALAVAITWWDLQMQQRKVG